MGLFVRKRSLQVFPVAPSSYAFRGYSSPLQHASVSHSNRARPAVIHFFAYSHFLLICRSSHLGSTTPVACSSNSSYSPSSTHSWTPPLHRPRPSLQKKNHSSTSCSPLAPQSLLPQHQRLFRPLFVYYRFHYGLQSHLRRHLLEQIMSPRACLPLATSST
jgi:hypothetical protein